MRVAPRPRTSRLALWSRRAALLAIPLLAAAIVGHRTDVIAAEPTLTLLAAGLACAAAAVLAALLAFAAIWRDAMKGFGPALIGITFGLAMLAYPAMLFTRLVTLPAIADVATDPSTPLEYRAVGWTHAAPGPGVIAAQQEAYPNLAPRAYAADPMHAFEEVVAIMEARGWEIVREEPPVPATTGPDVGLEPVPLTAVIPGTVEAVARTLVVGFREDVVVRVSAGATGAAVVDMRSASRVFQHDFGSNARRIEAFFSDLDRRLPRAAAN